MKNDCSPGSSITNMVTDLQWIPLEETRRYARLHMLEDMIAGGRVAINRRIKYSVLTPRHGQFGARTVIYKNSFFPSTIVQWNNTLETAITEIVVIKFLHSIGLILPLSQHYQKVFLSWEFVISGYFLTDLQGFVWSKSHAK